MSSPTEEFVIRRRRIPLDAAADQDAQGLVFTHLRVSDASDNLANFELLFANRDNDPVVIRKGIRLENFRIASGKIWLKHAAQPGKFVEIETWSGPQVGPPRIVDDGLVVDVNQSKASTLATVADVEIAAAGTVVVLAALSTRRRGYVGNKLSNTVTMRVGDVSVGAARGLELVPGEVRAFETTAAIHVHNPGGIAESVTVAWEAD